MATTPTTQQVNAILRPLRCDDAKMRRVADVFRTQMLDALRERPSSLQMENTYIPELPDGNGELFLVCLYSSDPFTTTQFRALCFAVLQTGEIKTGGGGQ